ncbi:MAG: DUF1292 domain-containing protein [Clostridia bacterium]|nr:DUF1292 domain-containing protein [Clostridia bacterium]
MENLDNEYFDAEVFTLTDEDGNEIQFEQIGICELDGVLYHALMPLNEDGTVEGEEYVILKSEIDEDGEEFLITVEDDEEFDRIADMFEDGFADIDYDGGSEE